jgi:hypothetical protein
MLTSSRVKNFDDVFFWVSKSHRLGSFCSPERVRDKLWISIRHIILKTVIEFRRNGTYKLLKNVPFLWNSIKFVLFLRRIEIRHYKIDRADGSIMHPLSIIG